MKLQQWLKKTDQAKLGSTCTHHLQAIQKNSMVFWSKTVQLFSYWNLYMIVTLLVSFGAASGLMLKKINYEHPLFGSFHNTYMQLVVYHMNCIKSI